MTTLTLDVPEELAARLAHVPREQVNRFAVAALSHFAGGTAAGLSEAVGVIGRLLTLPAGAADAPATAPPAVRRALEWTGALHDDAARHGLPFLVPHVTPGVKGEAVLEWWHGAKKLTLYVGEDRVEYVQSWGSDIETDMADGDADPADVRLRLWQWLTTP